MRLPRRSDNKKKNEPAPEDTQEMFTAGQLPPGDPGEEPTGDPDATREYASVGPGDDETVEFRDEAAGAEADDDSDPDQTAVLVEDAESIEAIEDEAWEGDEYEEWDEEEFDPEAGDEVEPADGIDDDSVEAAGETDPPRKPRGEDVKAWFGEFRDRVRTVTGRLLRRIGAIKLPNHELDGQKAMAVGGIILVAGMAGVAGYVLGKGSGDDIDVARLEGEFAGKRAGAVEGATSGYAAGFKKGRDIAFRKSYAASYKRNYIRAYEDVGLEPPKPRQIEVPKP